MLRLLLAATIVGLAVWWIARRRDTRLVLLGAGLALAIVGGRPLAVVDTFGRSMVAAMVAPICAAMGFAAVLKATECDRHLVRLLTAPLRRARWALVPGGIGAAYLVNLAVPSQSSVAAMLGPILLPLLLAAGLRPAAAGAALVLGASFGGDLLSPAAQDIQALAGLTGVDAIALSARVIPAGLAGLPVAALVFCLRRRPGPVAPVGENTPMPDDPAQPAEPIDFVRAVVPLVPVALLLLAHGGWGPLGWLVRVDDMAGRPDLAAALPPVRVLLIGVVLAAAADRGRRGLRDVSASLFEGMGAAYRDIISLTIAAQCFGAGVIASGLGDALVEAFGATGWGARSMSVVLPWGLATLSGSGSGPVLAFARACLAPLGDRPGLAQLAALTCLSAGFGRTTSPVSAVVVCGSGLVGVSPSELVRELLPALAAGAAVSLGVVLLRG